MVASTADQVVGVDLVAQAVMAAAYRHKMGAVSAPVWGWGPGRGRGPEVAMAVVCSHAFAKTATPCSQT